MYICECVCRRVLTRQRYRPVGACIAPVPNTYVVLIVVNHVVGSTTVIRAAVACACDLFGGFLDRASFKFIETKPERSRLTFSRTRALPRYGAR